MRLHKEKFTIGLEEELFVVNKRTRAIENELPKELFTTSRTGTSNQIIHEFLASQVELVTKPCESIQDLREQYHALRQRLIEVTDAHGLAPIGASTHPFSNWNELARNSSSRYQRIARNLKMAAQRMCVCGMHLHIGILDEKLRLRVHNQLRWYLPHILALTTSSPFWQGQDTGYNSYRLSVIDGLPRSGLPHQFDSIKAYHEYIDALIDAKAIKDATEIWWDARMSRRFPTLEMRVADVCTRAEDSIAIAALYACLVRWIMRNYDRTSKLRGLRSSLTAENRWQAARYPVSQLKLINLYTLEPHSIKTLMKQWQEVLADDAKALDCEAELAHILTICKRGTSADRQREVYREAMDTHGDTKKALKAVVDELVENTRAFSLENTNSKLKRNVA